MLDKLFDLETRTESLASRRDFAGRLARSVMVGAVIVLLSLAIGMWGYCALEGMSLIDGFLNAAMILSGMGPVGQLNTLGGKLFAGCYAIYSGVMLIATMSIVLAPVVHRFLHKFHIPDDDK